MKKTLLMTTALVAVFSVSDAWAEKNIDASYYTTPEGSWVYDPNVEHNGEKIEVIRTNDIADLTDDKVTISGVYAQTEFTDGNGTAFGMSIGNTQTEGYAHTKELTLGGSNSEGITRLDIYDRNENKTSALDLLNINDGAVINITNSEGLHTDGNINVTGGEINLAGSEFMAEDIGAKLNISGGVINIEGDENTLNGIGVEFPDLEENATEAYSYGSVDMTGGTINVNSGNASDSLYTYPDLKGNNLIGNDINISGGELNIAENSALNVIKGIKKNEDGTTSFVKSTINLTDEGVINLSGNLVSDVMGTGTGEGNGTLNINNSNAVVNGEVDDVNLNINADSKLSTLFTENEKEYTNLSSLNVNEGNTFTVDSELGVINTINVAQGAGLTVTGTDIYTFSKESPTDDITINGTLTATNSFIEAGNDTDGLGNNSNILLDGATVTLTDSDMEANGNITIKDTTLTSNSSGTGENGYGIWAEGNINVDGGTTKLTQSYLNADGDITINSGNITLIDSVMDSYNGDIVINGGTINMNGQSIDAINGSIEMTGGELNMNNSSNTGDQDVTFWAANGITISGGTINMNADEASIDTFYDLLGENGEQLPKPETAGDITITGDNTIINVNSNTAEISSEGTISIANGAQVNIAQNGALTSYNTFEIVDGDLDLGEKATLSLTDTGTINLAGKLNANVNGDGLFNVKSSSAVINGDITGSNLSFEADHSLSKAVNGSIGDLASLTVKKGTLTFDKSVASINNLNVDGTLNIGTNTITATTANFNDNSKLALKIASADTFGKINADTINVKDNTTMSVTLDSGVVVNGETAEFKVIDGTMNGDFTNKIADNSRYDIEWGEGSLKITGAASASDVVADAGGSTTNASTAAAWDSISSSANAAPTTKAVANVLNTLSQHNPKAYVEALTALAPDVAPAIQQTATETTNQVFGAVGTRLSGGSVSTGGKGASVGGKGHSMSGGHKGGQGHHNGHKGKSSGDNIFERAAMWVQGMFNKAELEDTSKSAGFDSETSGVAFGAEKFVTDDTKVGIGYAYSQTEIDGLNRTTDVDTHTAILYGEYKPSQWYVNGIATYGWSDYSEKKNVAGVNVNADYDAETFGLQAMTGYEMEVNGFGITPETGLRYVHIKQDTYKDSADQKISSDDNDILTGVIGAKVNKTWELENGAYITPEVRVAATYDIVNDGSSSVVTLANGSAYTVDGEPLDEFGLEFGAGVTAEINDKVEFSVGYEGKFKEDYQDHTGMLNAKYKF